MTDNTQAIQTIREALEFGKDLTDGMRKMQPEKRFNDALVALKKLQDAARSLGASGRNYNVQHGNAPSPCNAVLPDGLFYQCKCNYTAKAPVCIRCGEKAPMLTEAEVAIKARREALEEAAQLIEKYSPTEQTSRPGLFLHPSAMGIGESQKCYAAAIRALIKGEKS